MTSSSVGWVLVDDEDAQGAVLDHDVFDVQPSAGDTAGSTAQRVVAAVLRSPMIASATGHRVQSVGATWTDVADADGEGLLNALSGLGFAGVVAVRLPQACHAWSERIGGGSETRIAMCVLEQDTATVLVRDAGVGPVQTEVTHARESAADLSRWLIALFGRLGWQPEDLYLIGKRSDLYAIAWRLDEALPMPVHATADVQLALARGAALASSMQNPHTDARANVEPSRQGRHRQPGGSAAPHAKSWLRSHAMTLAVMMCGAAILLAALSLVMWPRFGPEKIPRPGDNRPAAHSSESPPAGAQTAPPPVPTLPTPQPRLPVAEPPKSPTSTDAAPERTAVPLPQLDRPAQQPADPSTSASKVTPQQSLNTPPVTPTSVMEEVPAEPDPHPGILSSILGGLK